MKPNTTWRVAPHGAIERLAENLHTVTGQLRMPLGETTRRMTIVSLTGGRIAIHSAIALDEPGMRGLESLGDPTYLIVPSAIHRLDARPYVDRYPSLEVIAPPEAAAKVSDVVHVDATALDLGDPRVKLAPVRGTQGRELAMTVESSDGLTLVLNDVVFNLPRIPGLAGLGLRALGFGPGAPTIPPIVKKKLVDDDAELADQLRAWSTLPMLVRVLVAHGAPLPAPRTTLRELADRLDARDRSRVSHPARAT